MTALTGNTYHVRQELRAMGAEWSKNRQAWFIGSDRAAEAQAMVDEVGTARANAARRPVTNNLREDLQR